MIFFFHAVCTDPTTLNETSGVITSPFYPGNYPYYQKCRWKITASEGKRVVLVIEDMSIRECNASCTCDYLEIQNGLPSDAVSSRKRCGNRNVAFYSINESLTVLFVANDNATFNAAYTQVNYTAGTCVPNVMWQGRKFLFRGRPFNF